MNLVDYHTHTSLCEHAKGTTDEYIKTACNLNLSEIGFSDHSPLPPDLRKGISMRPDQTEYYIKLIEEKRDTYKNDISVKIGFEVDFPFFDTFDKKYLTDGRIDYLIGSCHFIGDWAFDHPANISEFNNRDIDEVYKQYFTQINDLVNTKSFNIIGHFDVVKKFGHRPTKKINSIIEGIAKNISKNEIAVELNTAGLRKPVKEIYPSDEIIDILFDMNVPITLGSDAHSPDEVGYMFNTSIEKIKKAGYRKISGFSMRKRYDIVL